MFAKNVFRNNMDDNHLLANFKLPITSFHVTMLFKVEVAAVHISMLGRFFIQLFLGGALLILESVQAYFSFCHLKFTIQRSKLNFYDQMIMRNRI